MAKKKKSSNKTALKKELDSIQIIAIVVILLVVAGIAAVLVSSGARKQAEATPDVLATIRSQVPTAQAGQASSQPAEENAPTVPSQQQYASEPPMTIDVEKVYLATFKMAKGGEFVVQLFPDKAPRTVNSFVFLARDGYFNGVTFHRVLEGFMAQGGDPTGTGMGGPGYQFPNEDSDLVFDKAGIMAMANAGRDTNGSQFFITFDAAEFLNGGYTIFGQVIEGMDVVNGITRRDPDTFPDYSGDVIESITITEK